MNDFEYIKKYWNNQATNFKTNHEASWGDWYAISLEIDNISKYVQKGSTVLDVGCANGYSAFHQLAKKPKQIIGIDFSEEMIKNANDHKKKLGIKNIDFYVGDIRKIQFDNESFDLTYTTRVLINLPTWKDQKIGIEECLRVTRKGGKLIISEAFYEPLVLLNSLRTLKNLPPLTEHDFNRYLKVSNIENYLNHNNLLYEKIDFSSIYYLGSRFLRELVTDTQNYPGYSNPINEIFYKIEQEYSGGDFGIQMAYVITKQ